MNLPTCLLQLFRPPVVPNVLARMNPPTCLLQLFRLPVVPKVLARMNPPTCLLQLFRPPVVPNENHCGLHSRRIAFFSNDMRYYYVVSAFNLFDQIVWNTLNVGWSDSAFPCTSIIHMKITSLQNRRRKGETTSVSTGSGINTSVTEFDLPEFDLLYVEIEGRDVTLLSHCRSLL